MGGATLSAIGLCGMMEGLIPHPYSRDMSLLRDYSINGLRYLIPLLFMLLIALGLTAGVTLWSQFSPRRDGVAISAGMR